MSYETILVDRNDGVGVVTLNRPEAMNAFNDQLMNELSEALLVLDADDTIGAMIITGSEKAFAAGADIKEIAGQSFPSTFTEGFISRNWEAAQNCRKPIIAAVAGYALGGGCELAMMCDFIIAAENARFGQPELKIGVTPGAGGTQRLARAVGKAKAMDMILTGRMMDAAEAERSGLVSRVVPVEDLMETAMEAAGTIADLSRPASMMAKELVNLADEVSLRDGVLMERRMFQALFGTPDQKEGMAAFVDKRSPKFNRD